MTEGAFSRRDFLVGLTGLAALGSLAAIVIPGTERLVASQGTPLPEFVASSPQSVRAYRAALAQPSLLRALACYCGCASYAPPHRSLLDCFVQPAGGFEAHAAGCTTCQEEALEAQRLASAGWSVAEVRRQIDAGYSDRGPSTDQAAKG